MAEVACGLWLILTGSSMTYSNPLIHADYSDPDVIRHGEDYYMVASSFNSVPGLPVLHSRDLVHWRLVNHVIKSIDWPGYELPALGKGVWAPSIRFHDGRFYVYFGAPDEGIFMSSCSDPLGDWDPLVCVKKTVGWIDPCPFWDDDGNAYLVNAFANSRIGFKSVLRLNRLSPDGRQVLPEGRFIFDGQDRHQTMEGPKLHKRNGWYYIFAPAGGVEWGWQTVLRSRNIWGPYEDRIVLHQGNSSVNGPHQGAWVDTPAGEHWFYHFQDRGPFGRIVHLQPMAWDFDWPRIGKDSNNDGIGEPVLEWPVPEVSVEPEWRTVAIARSDDFGTEKLGLQWQWQANPPDHSYELLPSQGLLRLRAQQVSPGRTANLNVLTAIPSQKIPGPGTMVRVELTLSGKEGTMGGLVVLGRSYGALALRQTGLGAELVYLERIDGPAAVQVEQVLGWAVPAIDVRLSLGIEIGPDARCRFYAARPGEDLHDLGVQFAASPGVWVGAKIGLFSCGEKPDFNDHVDFSRFRMEP